jgi:hypothetical protein
MKKLLLAGAAIVLMATSAHAAYDECAVVLKTPDGFLAMRREPTVRSVIDYKLHRGDILVLNKSRLRWTNFDKKWIAVSMYREDIEGDGEEPVSGYAYGFVSRKYIQQFRCSDVEPTEKPEIEEHIETPTPGKPEDARVLGVPIPPEVQQKEQETSMPDEMLEDWCKRNDPSLTAQSCIELKSKTHIERPCYPKWVGLKRC